MAKAHITTKDGATVTIEGSHEEVAALIAKLGARPNREGRAVSEGLSHRKSTAKPTVTGLVSELIDGGFFKKPKELGAIKVALEEHGHFYPVTTLSPVVLRLVRKKELRRIKDKKRWLYVG